MIPQLIADASPDTLISGNWIIAVIGALFTGAALLLGKMQGRREASETTLKEPVPTVPTSKVYTPPTFSQHQELVRRVVCLENETKEHRDYVEGQLRDIRRENSEQFVKLMTAGETRKDAIMENMNAMVRGFHARVDQLVDGHLHLTPFSKKS